MPVKKRTHRPGIAAAPDSTKPPAGGGTLPARREICAQFAGVSVFPPPSPATGPAAPRGMPEVEQFLLKHR